MASDTIYIDPTYAGQDSDGSLTKPYLSWADIGEFQDSTSYLQKRGTTCDIGSQLLIRQKDNVEMGVYGEGPDYANLNDTSGNYLITIMASSHCKIDGYHLTSTYEGTIFRIVDDWDTTCVHACMHNTIQNSFIDKAYIGIRVQRVGATDNLMDSVYIENVKVHDIYQDGIFIQGYKPINEVLINNCYIDSVNMCYDVLGGVGENIAGGDGIQISNLVTNWMITNTTIDRHKSFNKFCIIANDAMGSYATTGIVENCTLYPSSGGSAFYLSGLDSVIIRYNKVFVNENSVALMNRYGTKTYCYYNTFSGTSASPTDKFFDIGGGPNYITNNTFYSSSVQVINYADEYSKEGWADNYATYVYNNIFSDVGAVYGGSTKTDDSNYNVFFNSTGDRTERNSIYGMDPKFVDAEAGDFHLMAGSPCISSAKDLGFAVDIAGTSLPVGDAVEIGAYEYITTDTVAPGIPTDLALSDTSYTSFTFIWDGSTDNDSILGYYVYFDGEYYTFTDSTSIQFTDLVHGTLHLLNVKAKDINGNFSALSDTLYAYTLTSSDNEAPSVPTGLTASNVSEYFFDLDWIASTDNVGVARYDIYIDSVLYATTDTNSYTIDNLTPSTTYLVAISARDAVNNISERSSELSVTMADLCTDTRDWENTSFDAQTGDFTAEFDLVPNSNAINGVVGLSNGSASAFDVLSCIIQFNDDDGKIYVRNGGTYTSDIVLRYFSDTLYHCEMFVSVSSQTYSVSVTPEGGATVVLATDYSFRAAATQLNNYALRSEVCTYKLTNFKIDGIPVGLDDNEALFFDFGSGTSPDNWNNITTTTTEIANAINSNGIETSVSLSVYDAFDGVNYDGPTGVDIPYDASNDSFFGENSGSSGGILLSGLKPDTEYTLVILSARRGSGENRETQFVITGASKDTLAINSYGNTGILAITVNPSADSTLDIQVTAGPNNTNSNLYYYINTLQVYEITSTKIGELDFDFGSSSSPVNWNTITTATTKVPCAINSDGDRTSVQLSVYDTFDGVNYNGPTGLDSSLDIPDGASGDSFYGQDGNSEGIQLSGLDPDLEYTLVILSAREGSGENRETQFVISGTSIDTLAIDSYGNTETLSITVNPAADGTLDIQVTAGPNNTDSNLYHYLNLLKVIEEETITAESKVNFDFGNSTSPDNWNNVSISTTEISDAVNSNGETTSIGLSVYDALSVVNTNGATGLNSSLDIPDDASGDSFYGNVATYSGYTEPTGGIEVNGLNPEIQYTLAILSSRMGVTDNRETQFIITGLSVDTLLVNSAGNTDIISGTYYPAADSTIKIDVGPGSNNDNSYYFYYLNTLQVSYADATTAISSKLGMTNSSISHNIEKTTQQCLIYPNPASDIINLEVSCDSELKIIDLSGRILSQKMLESGKNSIQLNLKSGIYCLHISYSDGSINTTRVVIK